MINLEDYCFPKTNPVPLSCQLPTLALLSGPRQQPISFVSLDGHFWTFLISGVIHMLSFMTSFFHLA